MTTPVYKTVIKDITTSIVNQPDISRTQTRIKAPYRSFNHKKNYTTSALEPNAGHNATVNSYVFNPSLTTLQKPTAKDEIKFTEPIIDESLYEQSNQKQSENLLNKMEKELVSLQKENIRSKGGKTAKGKEKVNYISQEEIARQKEALFKDVENSNQIFLEKKRKKKQALEALIKLNEGRPLEVPNQPEEEKVYDTDEEIQNILNEDQELLNKRIARLKSYSYQARKAQKVFRKGYMNNKPIDIKDEKFIKKYARYLLFKKIQDDITGDDDDEYEREYAKYIFTANSSDSPRSLTINTTSVRKNKKAFRQQIKMLNETSTLSSEMKLGNYYSFIAFIKMLFAMLDKEKNQYVTKETILNEMNLDEKIVQDLGFESTEAFERFLSEYVPENAKEEAPETFNQMSERDFVKCLLSQCEFKDDVLFYLDQTEEARKSKKKLKRKGKRKGGNDSSVELTETDEEDETLPGMRTHVYDFLDEGNDKQKLDKLNEMLSETMAYNKKEEMNTNFGLSKKRKIKLKIKNEKMKISYHEYLTFLRRYHTKDQINFTIPEPFEFLKRDYQQKKIEKMKEILEDRVAKEDVYVNYRFHAIKLKEGIWGNQLQNIVEREKSQRMRRQEKLKEKIVAEMRPFSFYDEDERKYKEKLQQECQPQIFPPFRANAIKWKSQVNIYEDMLRKQKEEREKRVKERMEKTLKASKLPPRMQMHFEELKRKEEEEKLYGKKRAKSSKHRFKANKVPDFARLQNEFESKIEAMKKAAVPTEFAPFTFHEPKKKIELCQFLDNENNPSAKNPITRKDINTVIKKMQRKPKLEPATTKSLNLLMETRRKELEERQRKQDELEFDDRLRKEKQERLKFRVQNSKAIVDNRKQLEENRRKIQEEFQRDLQRKKETYDAELQRRIQKVYNRPLLLEQVGGKGEKFSLNRNNKDDLNELLAEQAEIEGEEEEIEDGEDEHQEEENNEEQPGEEEERDDEEGKEEEN